VSLYDPRLVLFSGKGGVGKTTVASGYALSCAQRGERTLLMELNVQDRFSSYFGSREVGSEIVEVEENLHAVNVTPAAALEEYGMMLLRVKLIYRAVFENQIVQTFLRAIPGLDELLMIGKAFHHATEEQSDGSAVWDKVVVDAPATGHGLFLLQIPTVITSSLSSGHMYERAKEIFAFLSDPEKTALNLVTLAEEMPVNETMMLRNEAREKIGIPTGNVIINGLYPSVFDDGEAEWLADLRDSYDGSDAGLTGMLDAAAFRRQRIGMQRRYVGKLHREMEGPFVDIPYYFTDRMTFPQIEAIAERFAEQAEEGV
jgi:anion-transporting  ArsA/GET3 family ATPase